MTKSALYCFSSIPQAAASVYFYDFNKDKNDGLKYKVEEIIKILKDNSFNPLQTNSYDISSFADGAYPFYVKINNSKKVDTIYFELRNNCGWASSMFFERPERLIKEREMKKNMPEGYQLDMTLAPAMAVKFKLRNQKGYFSLEIPKARCHIMKNDSTVELIAHHILKQLKALEPEAKLEVKAFEGVNKGAIANG